MLSHVTIYLSFLCKYPLGVNNNLQYNFIFIFSQVACVGCYISRLLIATVVHTVSLSLLHKIISLNFFLLLLFLFAIMTLRYKKIQEHNKREREQKNIYIYNIK